MTQVTWQPQWIDNAFFLDKDAINCKLLSAVVEQRTNGKQDIVIHLVSETAEARMSVWGMNLKRMIDAFGQNTDKWAGNQVKVQRTLVNGKTHKMIFAL
jgi:hypothetical protein